MPRDYTHKKYRMVDFPTEYHEALGEEIVDNGSTQEEEEQKEEINAQHIEKEEDDYGEEDPFANM